MLKREFYETRNDGVNLYKSYSDEGYKIQKAGTDEIYDEAIDVENSNYEYVEIDEKIEKIEDATTEDYLAALNRFGVS